MVSVQNHYFLIVQVKYRLWACVLLFPLSFPGGLESRQWPWVGRREGCLNTQGLAAMTWLGVVCIIFTFSWNFETSRPSVRFLFLPLKDVFKIKASRTSFVLKNPGNVLVFYCQGSTSCMLQGSCRQGFLFFLFFLFFNHDKVLEIVELKHMDPI